MSSSRDAGQIFRDARLGFAAFVFGGVVGVALMAFRRASRKTALPFGPFMLLGAAVGVAAGTTLAHSYLSLTGII